MTERAPVWFARAVLVAPLLVGLYFVGHAIFPGLAGPEHHSNNFWPYGHPAYGWTAVLAVVSYIVLGPIALILAVFLCFVGVMEIGFLARKTWCVAWRQDHVQWRKRWRAFNLKYVQPERPFSTKEYRNLSRVTYRDPQPLVRGRIGIR